MTSALTDQTTAIVEEDLSVHLNERCDRCGARAYVKVTVPGGLPLAFCNHHYRTHADALKIKAVKINDGRGALKD